MQKASIEPDVSTYEALIKTCAQNLRLKEAWDMVARMEKAYAKTIFYL